MFSAPIKNQKDLDKLSVEKAIEGLEYVYETIRLIRGKLAAVKALIGFCGAPWTLATYMIEEQGTKTYAQDKKLIYTFAGTKGFQDCVTSFYLFTHILSSPIPARTSSMILLKSSFKYK